MSEEKPSKAITKEQATAQPAASTPSKPDATPEATSGSASKKEQGTQGKPTSGTRPKANQTKQSPGRGSNTLIILLLIAILGAIAAGAYFGQQLWQQQTLGAQTIQSLSDRLREQSLALSKMQQTEQSLGQSVSTTQNQLETALKAQQNSIDSFAAQLNAIKGSTRKDWLLAEAEYLLRIANQRLVIEKDTATSEALFQAADQVLAEIDDAALMPVRIKIAEELLLLRSQARGQVESLLMRLNAVSNHLATMNLDPREVTVRPAMETTETSTEESGQSNDIAWWQQLLNKLGSAFSKAISIQRLEEPHSLPPSPEYSAYLKQNLALRIEQAKLLLMRHRFDEFTQELGGTIEWAHRSFPSYHPSVAALLNELSEINAQRPQTRDLDVSGSRELLKAKIEQKYREHSLDIQKPAEISSDKGAAE